MSSIPEYLEALGCSGRSKLMLRSPTSANDVKEDGFTDCKAELRSSKIEIGEERGGITGKHNVL